MSCCNHRCNQGRDCPERQCVKATDRQVKVVFWALAFTLALLGWGAPME